MLRNRAVVALVAWTLLVWTTRIGNIWRDEGLDTAGKVGRTALALSFTVLAAAVAVAAWRRAGRALRVTVTALAAWTTAVWVVRSVAIATGDHDAAFVAVHLVLAVVSIALSALALRAPVTGAREREEPTATAARPAPASGSGSHPRP